MFAWIKKIDIKFFNGWFVNNYKANTITDNKYLEKEKQSNILSLEEIDIIYDNERTAESMYTPSVWSEEGHETFEKTDIHHITFWGCNTNMYNRQLIKYGLRIKRITPGIYVIYRLKNNQKKLLQISTPRTLRPLTPSGSYAGNNTTMDDWIYEDLTRENIQITGRANWNERLKEKIKNV